MKYLIVLCCVVAAVIADDKYTDKYDDIDVIEFMQNKRLMASMADCLDDKGPCSPEGKELKSHIKDALENGCAKCTEVQRAKTPEVIRHLINNELALWQQATAKYDPTGEYRKKYEQQAKEHNINLP